MKIIILADTKIEIDDGKWKKNIYQIKTFENIKN